MANPKIEVEIGAVIDGLRKGFGDSVKIIETLEKQALELDKALKAATDLPEIQNLNSKLAQTKAALSQLKSSGIDPLTKATSNYNSVGTDFARIIQDAPFGIIGVGNNIQQLAGSFQQLKNSTGSTSGALKAAFASILSPANAVVLGISILTTALTVLQMQGFFKTEEAAKSLADELDKYKETLGETTQAQLEGAATADKEIIKIQSLKAVIEDESVSREKRLAAVQKLREEAPSIFKNLSDEQILAGKVGDSYNRLTQILVARATASSGINKIVALADEERIILEKNAEVLQQISAFEQKAANFRAQGQQELVLINENQIRYLKQQNPEIQRLAEIEAERVKLTGLVNENLIASVDYNDKNEKSSKAINKEKEKELKFDDQNIANLEFGNKLRDEALKKLGLISSNVDRLTAKKVTIEFDGTPLSAISQTINSIVESTPSVVASLENIGKVKIDTSGFVPTDIKPDELKKSFSPFFDIVTELTNAFGGLGSIIGNAFGNNPKLGQFIAQFVGFAAKLIAANFKIAASNAVAGASQAAAATGPGAPIALPAFIAGSLAVVAGAFAAFGGGGGKKSGGGGGGGGSSVGSSGVGGGTSFAGGGQGGLFQQNRDLNGELVVRGQDLVYVFGQASNRINKG